METEKRCTICGRSLPVTAFHRSSKSSDGRRGQCKECRSKTTDRVQVREQNQRYYAANTEKENARSAAYLETKRESINDRKRRYHARNREVIADRRKAKYTADPTRVIERGRRWRAKNPEKMAASMRQWKKKNPSIVAHHKSRWKAKRRGLKSGSHTHAEWEALLIQCGRRCLRCGAASVRLTKDHVVPIIRGGSDDITNIQPLCNPCNGWKGDRIIDYRNSV